MRPSFNPCYPAVVLRATCLLMFGSLLQLTSRGSDPGSSLLRVAFFYNSSIFSDSYLRTNVEHLLVETNGVVLNTLAYQNPVDFRQRFHQYMQTNGGRCDLVLGPTESAALKALNDSLTNHQTVPFLAPFITTPPEEYPHIDLTTASASDRGRVRTAVEDFVNYTGARIMAILHTDDLWGRAMVKEFRAMLGSPETIVHAEPVEEFKGGLLNRTNDYRSFISKMREHSATLIGVALLTDEAANQFLADLDKFNRDKWVPYKPTVFLLSQPRFDTDNVKDGVLYSHLEGFSVFYVANCLKTSPTLDMQQVEVVAPYLDACEIIVRAASAYTNTIRTEDGYPLPVHHVLGFYRKEWESGLRESTYQKMITGFHAERLGFTNRVLAVTRASVRNGKLVTQPVAGYFDRGPLIRLFHSGSFFLQHHRVLWNRWTLLLFVGVALGSFFHVIHLKSEKPPWMLLRTRPFWSLFVLNLLVTYFIWVISIHFGVFGDANVGAALALAAACPTAASALGDIARRYLPMIDLSGIIRILEKINEQMLSSIGKEKLDKLARRLEELSPDNLKSKFLDVLLLKLGSGDLRSRIREQLRKKLADMQQELEQLQKDTPDIPARQISQEQDRLERKIYAASLITALGYLCSNSGELNRKVEELLAGEPVLAAGL